MKHLDQKYFTYRVHKVAAATAQYPDRSGVLKTSEYLRLGFVGVGALLCALVFGALAYTAGPRVGWLEWRTMTFFICTAFATGIVLRVFFSILTTMRIHGQKTIPLS